MGISWGIRDHSTRRPVWAMTRWGTPLVQTVGRLQLAAAAGRFSMGAWMDHLRSFFILPLSLPIGSMVLVYMLT